MSNDGFFWYIIFYNFVLVGLLWLAYKLLTQWIPDFWMDVNRFLNRIGRRD